MNTSPDDANRTPRPAEDRIRDDIGTPDDLAFDLEALWEIVDADDGDPAGGDPLIGTTIGGVTLLRLVGEGGMGRVYEGHQSQPARSVALKLQRPGRPDRESTKRFLRELELLGRLSHPAICRVFGAGLHAVGGERLPWFVMEFVPEALPITTWAAARSLPLRERVALCRDVCSGVAVAHAGGIVHRDLKAGNILVGRDGQPKVIDFGVATAFRGDLHATSLTHSGRLVGTLATLAPELLDARRPEESPRSDVWALGVILHELVTGEPPFRIGEGSVVGAIEAIRSHKSSIASRARSTLGRQLGSTVDRALAPQPDRRQPDAGAMARELSAILDRFPAGASEWGRGEHLTLGERTPSRRAWLWPAVGAMGIAAATIPWWTGPRARGPGNATGVEARTRGVETNVERTLADAPGDTPADMPYDPPPFASSPIERPDFTHVVRDIDDPEAKRHLVEKTGMTTWHEPFNLHCRYWAPREQDVEGSLVFRYDFARPSRRIYLNTRLAAWDDQQEKGVIGRGAGAIEYSTDGAEWHPLENRLEPPEFGRGIHQDGLLPEGATGSRSLWIRVRLLVAERWANASYSVAQFMRTDDETTDAAFALEVECEPAEGGESEGGE